MKKKIIYIFLILFSFYFTNSCADNEIQIKEENELKKGTNEYNLGVLKIFKFENNQGHIDKKLAKNLGFSSKQIREFEEEVYNNNILIQKEINKGAEVESFNPKNNSAEEILNQKDIEEKNYQKKNK